MVNKSTVNKGECHKILRDNVVLAGKMLRRVLILEHETNSLPDAETLSSCYFITHREFGQGNCLSTSFDIAIATVFLHAGKFRLF